MHTSLYELAPQQRAARPSRPLAPPPPLRTATPTQRRAARLDWHLLALLFVTALGGAFRFYHLTVPTLWNDEAKTFWRVCGTYEQMLVPLRTDGFPPLHYSIYWLLAQVTTLTPWMMRLVPAVAGTLTIPAMYFLARQFLPRATSLVSAAFVACSAFALFYSRDAKMYPHTWLFITLNVGCLLWWCRTRRSTAWLCWVAAGCMMVGLHASALTIPAISLVIFLTQRRLHWRQSLAFAAGVLLIYAGPIGYYSKFNRWTENVDEQGWRTSGLTWLSWYNGDRTGPELVHYTGSAFLAGYEWPRPEYLREIPEPLVRLPQLAITEVFVILAVALLPWPLILRPRREPGRAAAAPWQVMLWLAVWIVLPAYVFYCHSIRQFASPSDWIDAFVDWVKWPGVIALSVALVVYIVTAAIFPPLRRSLVRFFQFALVTVVIYYALVAVHGICHSAAAEALAKGRPWRSIWTPRYLGFTFPAVVLAVAVLLTRLPTRAVRLAAIVFVLAVNVAMAGLRVTLDTEPPIDRVAADVWASQPRDATVRTYVTIDRGDGTVAGGSLPLPVGRFYLQSEAKFSPMSPDAFLNILSRFRLWRNMDGRAIAADAKANPKLQRLIVWDYDNPKSVRADRTVRAFKGWSLADDAWYTARDYWDWRERWQMHRMEFVRLPGTVKQK